MRDGTLARAGVVDAGGQARPVRSCRLVSLEHRHLAAISYEVTLLDHAAPVVISSQVVNRQDAPALAGHGEPSPDPRLATTLPHRVLEPRVATAKGERLLLGYRTANSGMTLGVGVDHVIETPAAHAATSSAGENWARWC